MHMNYFYEADRTADPGQDRAYRDLLKAAGVDTLWLEAVYSGRPRADAETLKRAVDVLGSEGFDTGLITLPVGHPGNSLNPEDDALDVTLPKGWRYRKDADGNNVYHCGCIEPYMLSENKRLLEMAAQCGAHAVFHDDDLRQGNWGPELQGCFCDECIAAFNEATGRHETRASLKRGLYEVRDPALRIDWAKDLCRKVERLITEVKMPGMKNGVMIMQAGDERHGLDVRAMAQQHPDLMFRVGEAHFNNAEYDTPARLAEEWVGVLQHLSWMEGHPTYSETTVFPPRMLTPENMLSKARLAIAAGVDHIFYMSGTWRMTPDYWTYLARGRENLEELSELMGRVPRIYPVHVANGTTGALGEPVYPPLLPFLSGLPCRPVRGADPDEAADVLLFFGAYAITPQWEKKFTGYKAVILDEAAAAANPVFAAAHRESLLFAPFTAGDTAEHAAALRDLIREAAPDPMPMLEGGIAIPVWLGSGQVMCFSLENRPVEVTMTYGKELHGTRLLQPAGHIQ